MKAVIILIFFLVALTTQATVLENLHLKFSDNLVLGNGSAWKATRLLVGIKNKIEFVVVDKQSRNYSFEGPENAFLIRSETHRWGERDFLLTLWQDGNQRYALRVFDPLSHGKELVLEKSGIGEVLYDFSESGLNVTVQAVDTKTMGTKEVKTFWQAVKK